MTPGHVADRPNAFGGAAAFVDGDALGVRLDADRFQADALDAWRPAGRDEQLLPADLLAVAQRDHALAVLEVHSFGAGVEAHVDAFLSQDVEDEGADRRVLAVDQVVCALHEGDLDPEAAEELAELDADRAAAEDHDARRQGLERRRLAVGPVAGVCEAVDRRDARVAAGGDDDPLRFQCPAVDIDTAGAGDPRFASNDGHSLPLVAGDLAAVVEVADHVVAVLGDLRPLDLRLGDACCSAGVEAGFRRPQQRLGGDAGPIGALAADQLALDERHVESLVVEARDGDLAGRAGSDHDGVESLAGHVLPPALGR